MRCPAHAKPASTFTRVCARLCTNESTRPKKKTPSPPVCTCKGDLGHGGTYYDPAGVHGPIGTAVPRCHHHGRAAGAIIRSAGTAITPSATALHCRKGSSFTSHAGAAAACRRIRHHRVHELVVALVMYITTNAHGVAAPAAIMHVAMGGVVVGFRGRCAAATAVKIRSKPFGPHGIGVHEKRRECCGRYRRSLRRCIGHPSRCRCPGLLIHAFGTADHG